MPMTYSLPLPESNCGPPLRGESTPQWLTWNGACVVKVAQAIRRDREFSSLPVLADALEEAGCDNTAILEHCRRLGPHGHRCWVVDLLLGEE
jgi:hypothetical protein